MQNPPEDLAIQAARDPDAFVSLYNAYFTRVYNYIRYRCGDPCTTEDLTEKVFERLLANIGKFSPHKGFFEPWLFAIVRNVVNDYYQSQRHPWLPWESLRRQPTGEPSTEEKLIRQESLDELQAAMLRLDSRSRDLLSLKFFARLTNRQIAQITNLSESAVGVALFRAIGKLRDGLAENPAGRGSKYGEKEWQDGRA